MFNYQGGIRKIKRAEAKLGVLLPSSLLYADDILVFCKASRENVLMLRDIFEQYGNSSGQIVSPSKSRVFFGRQIQEEFRHYFFRSLHFVEGSFPFSYLGVPIFTGKLRVVHLRPVANKILEKFDRWSGNSLSLAGRVCLVNNVIASSLTHSMMVYKWPRQLLKEVDVAMRNFVWTGDKNKTKHGVMAWSRVCAPCKEGGLGVRSIRAANESYLYKLAWDIITQKDMGLNFVLQRHSTASGKEVKYHIASSIWCGLGRIRAHIRDNIRWIPGANSKVRFWTDNWLGFVIAEKIGIP